MRLLSALIPNPWSVEQFVANIAEYRGRPIMLAEKDLGGGTEPSGVTIASEERDYIFVQAGETGARRDLILMHEAAHIVLGHVDELARASSGDTPVVMWRHMYLTQQERHAELVATLMLLQLMSRSNIDDTDIARIASVLS